MEHKCLVLLCISIIYFLTLVRAEDFDVSNLYTNVYNYSEDDYDFSNFSYYSEEYTESYVDYYGLNSAFCAEKWSCGGLRNSSESFPQTSCYCDELCGTLNDCCGDYSAEKQTIEIEKDMFSCISLHEVDRTYNVHVVGKCPSVTSEELRQLCETNDTADDIISQLPVTGINNRLMYKNRYCAQCHMEDFRMWQAEYKCRNDMNRTTITGEFLAEEVRNERCTLTFNKPTQLNTHFRLCVPYTDTCPVGRKYEGKEIHEKCINGAFQLVFVTGFQGQFKNKYCAQCNSVDLTTLSCFSHREYKKRKFSYSLSILLDITSDGVRIKLKAEKKVDGKSVENLLTCQDDVFNYTSWECSRNERLSQNHTEPYSEAESLATMIGLILSLVALFASIVVYLCLPPLWNIPGKSLLCLTSCLFVAEFLFLIASFLEDIRPLCKTVAIAMHYFFLSAFGWMSVMAFDVWFTFSKGFVKSGDRGKSSKRFYLYMIGAFGFSCLFVVAGILTDELDTNEDSLLRPAYGHSMCWISNNLGRLIFFAAPVMFLLALNYLFFFCTARNIYVAKKNSEEVLGKREKCRFFIYVKLSTIMGLTWVFGFLSAITKNEVLRILFILFNISQGFLICLSFVFTKKVVHLMRRKIRRSTKLVRGKPTPGGSSTQTTTSSRPMTKITKVSDV